MSDWWKLFNSHKLNDIVKNALDNNQILQTALSNLRQSQNILRSGYCIFYQQIDASVEVSREQTS
jgi:outer membrane protein TolC